MFNLKKLFTFKPIENIDDSTLNSETLEIFKTDEEVIQILSQCHFSILTSYKVEINDCETLGDKIHICKYINDRFGLAIPESNLNPDCLLELMKQAQEISYNRSKKIITEM